MKNVILINEIFGCFSIFLLDEILCKLFLNCLKSKRYTNMRVNNEKSIYGTFLKAVTGNKVANLKLADRIKTAKWPQTDVKILKLL